MKLAAESKSITDLRKWVKRTQEAWDEYQKLGADESATEDQINRACAYFEWCAERVDFDSIHVLLAEWDFLRAAVQADEHHRSE